MSLETNLPGASRTLSLAGVLEVFTSSDEFLTVTWPWLCSAVTGVSNSEADTWILLPLVSRVLRDLTSGLGLTSLRLEAVSGHEEAAEDCDTTEEETEGGVLQSVAIADIAIFED